MIIDSHVHLVGEGWVKRSFLVGMAREAAAMMGKASGRFPDAETLVDNLIPALADTTGEKLVAAMDAAGIDKACIFTVDYGLATGEPDVSIEEQNRLIAEAARRFPDRLLSFFTVDPRRDGALDMFRRAVEDLGMRGLKLHPTSGYHPYDPVVYPLYEQCMEYGLPVLFHTGTQPAPLKFRFARPIYIDDVAADFPDLPIIMAHVGHHLWEEALAVASVKPNTYVDISNWQMVFNRDPARFYRTLRAILDEIGPWRVFFASDGPYLNVILPLDKWVRAVKEPDLSSCPEVSFSGEEIDAVMGGAFARLMNL